MRTRQVKDKSDSVRAQRNEKGKQDPDTKISNHVSRRNIQRRTKHRSKVQLTFPTQEADCGYH
jgi:hypothetical protein